METWKAFWEDTKNKIKQKNHDYKPLQLWFDPADLIQVEETDQGKRFKLGVPTDLHKYWISNNLYDSICSEIGATIKSSFDVEIVVTKEMNYKSDYSLNAALEQVDIQNQKSLPTSQERTETHGNSEYSHKRDYLNPNYTFHTFVVGQYNSFAHALGFKIANDLNGKERYNPLFIYGPTGMGKTHLLHAIGNHVKTDFPQIKICYISAERFLNEFVSSMRHKNSHEFAMKYRDGYNILLMDDIQFLSNKEGLQEQFFNLINAYVETGRQVCVACDRMPRDIVGLADRIRTRLEGGVIADIRMPDFEERMAIIAYKAEAKGMKVNHEVKEYIAKISKRSVREIEGNLNAVKLYSELYGVDINLEIVKKVLTNHTTEAAALTVEDIQKLVGEQFNIKLTDLRSTNRSKPIVTARQVAMYLIKKYLEKSLQDIGNSFGGKDHTTVLSAIKKINDQLDKDADLRREVDDLEAKIHNITGV